MGVETDKIRSWRHDRLPTFGVGADLRKPQWQAVFRQMMARDLVRPDPARHGALVMTHAATPVLKGEETVEMRKAAMASRTRRPAPKQLVSEEDAPLLSALKAKRRALAEAARVPAYVVFPDRTLIEMAEARPASLDEMARVNGVGAKKLSTYGRAFLEVIAGGAPEMHPARERLAGRPEGALFDRLQEAELRLARGEDGTGRPMSLGAAILRRIAERHPASEEELERVPGMDARRVERFGEAFLEILSGA